MPSTPHPSQTDRTRATTQNMATGLASEHGVEQNAYEPDFKTFAEDQDPLDMAAATWVTRKRSGLNAKAASQLQTWLQADPRHAQRFKDMDTMFKELQNLPANEVAHIRAQHSDLAAPRPTQAHAPQNGRRSSQSILVRLKRSLPSLMPQAAAAMTVCCVLIGSWMGWNHYQRQPMFEQTFTTAIGHQLQATLPDGPAHTDARGSTVQLDTSTRALVRLYRDRREVHLDNGQALFAVQRDPQRPFHVYAGALRITVVGTQFSVRHTDTGLGAGHTIVEVEEGRVRVEKRPANSSGHEHTMTALDTGTPQGLTADQRVELTAGQTVEADSRGHIGPIKTRSAHAIAPWRSGRISFEHTPLSQAIAEFERYGRTGLVVRDADVAALPVGGSYSLQQWQQFSESLPQVLPVRLVHRSGVTEVVSR